MSHYQKLTHHKKSTEEKITEAASSINKPKL